MNTAQSLAASCVDDFGPGLPLYQELVAAGGKVIDSSQWATSYQRYPWNLWQFPDGSQAWAAKGRLTPAGTLQ